MPHPPVIFEEKNMSMRERILLIPFVFHTNIEIAIKITHETKNSSISLPQKHILR